MWFAKALQILGTVIGLFPKADPVLQYLLPPSAESAVQKVESEIVSIMGEITNVEAFYKTFVGTPGGGAAKLAAARPYISKIILASPALVGKKIADEAKFEASVDAVTSAFVDILNNLQAQ